MADKQPIESREVDLAAELPGDPVIEALEWTIDNTILVDELLAKVGDDRDLALAVYGRFKDAINELTRAQDAVGKLCIQLVPPFQPVPVPGGGVFKIGGGSEKKNYDQPALIAAAAARMQETMELAGIITKDGEHGEAAPIVAAIVKKTAELCGAMAPSFNSWRAGVAKELGLKLDDYCEKTTSDLTHRIESRPSA